MKRVLLYSILPLVLVLRALVLVLSPEPSLADKCNKVLSTGDHAPTFSRIPAVIGGQDATLNLDEIKEDIVVLAFLNDRSPFAMSLDQRLNELVKQYKGKSIKVVGISVGRTRPGTVPGLEQWAKAKGPNFVYAFDEARAVGKAYGVTQTPQFVVLDKDRVIRYIGFLDDSPLVQDRPTSNHDRDELGERELGESESGRGKRDRRHRTHDQDRPTRPYLESSIDALLAGRTPEVSETRPVNVEVGDDAIPAFPWPIPKCSAFVDIEPAKLMRKNRSSDTLGDVAATLKDAFNQANYIESSCYSVPGGFAIVSRLEAILPDGSPAEPRWPEGYILPTSWNLFDLIRYLFTTKKGYYRIIVFVITSRPIKLGPNPPDPGDLEKEVFGGVDRLPAEIGGKKFTKDYHCRAIIYEFTNDENTGPALVSPSSQNGKTHLLKSNLWVPLVGQ